jgi:hypothetical protein
MTLLDYRCECSDPGSGIRKTGYPGVFTAVVCGDGNVVDDGLAELRKWWEEMAEKSSFADTHWDMRLHCASVCNTMSLARRSSRVLLQWVENPSEGPLPRLVMVSLFNDMQMSLMLFARTIHR